MKPSEYVKKEGLRSLKTVIDETGVSLQTLQNWYKNKPVLFRIVVLGVKSIVKGREEV